MLRILRTFLLAAGCALAACWLAPLGASAQGEPAGCPPKTQTGSVVDTLHGVRVADPYRWLEDQQSPATRAWIDAEDRCTNAVLDRLPGRQRIAAFLTTLLHTDAVGVPIVRGNRFFYMKRAAGEDLSLIIMREGVDGKEEALVDPRPMSADHSTSVSLLGASDDGGAMLYGVRQGGQDEVTLRVMDVSTRRDLPDQFLRRHYFSVGLTGDRKGLYFGTTTPAGPRVIYHRMGTPAAEDKEIFGSGYSPQYLIEPQLYDNGRWLVITVSQGASGNNEIYAQDLASKGALRPIAKGIAATFDARVAGHTLYMDTDWKAPNHRIVAVDLAGDVAPERWRTVVPESRQPIESFSLAGGKLIVSYIADAASKLKIFDASGKPAGEIRLPEFGTAGGVESRWDSNTAMFAFQSFAIGPTVYRYDVASRRLAVWARQQTPVNPADFVTRQVWFRSKDGTRVPMFLFRRKGVVTNGAAPTLLTGYGGFDVSSTPTFNDQAIAWAEHGGVWALANMRGGSEFGEAWHKAGMLGKKQNVFDDFYAAAQYLIQNHITNPHKLAIGGASNGGLLVGASLTQRPALFQAVVCLYPLLDMLRYQKFMGGPWWVSEYGSADDAAQFPYLLKYSPYQNVHPGTEYPSVLFITGDGDTRVAPLHARKMAARLQAAAANAPEHPILLLYDTKSGHSGGRPVGEQVKELTNILSFLFWQLGVKVGG
ncbi:MAG TPA: prolyl oligopeptidase family serine peptidase [Candidatus Acidoferrales bacterium]|nr:prolyl oligopeptidase family serine peptidase [Candidatus Acidoferrales bacterium]